MLCCLEGRTRCNKLRQVQERQLWKNNMCTEAKEVRKVEEKLWVIRQKGAWKQQKEEFMPSARKADKGNYFEKYLRFFWQENGSNNSYFMASGTCLLSNFDCSLLNHLWVTITTFFIDKVTLSLYQLHCLLMGLILPRGSEIEGKEDLGFRMETWVPDPVQQLQSADFSVFSLMKASVSLQCCED